MVNSWKSRIGKYAVMMGKRATQEHQWWLTSAYSSEDAVYQCVLEARLSYPGSEALRVVPYAGEEPNFEDLFVNGPLLMPEMPR